MTLESLSALLDEVEYKDWEFLILPQGAGNGFFLQIRFVDDAGDGAPPQVWTGRKWYISPHATRSEVVQTALKAVLTAEEHEARERFLFRGKAVFGPHLDVERLLEVADALDIRVPH